MNKIFNVFFLGLSLVMISGLIYLSLKVTDLNEKYYATYVKQELQSKPDTTLSDKIAALTSSLDTQKQTISNLKQELADLKVQTTTPPESNFLPAPEYSLAETVFVTNPLQGNTYKVTGNTVKMDSFLERNEIFLEYLLKKILPFEYDRSKNAIYITDIMPNSLFAQMGFKKGDYLLSINGNPYVKGMDVRYKLIENDPKKIMIQRNKQTLVLDIGYNAETQKTSQQISLNITKQQFNDNLTRLLGNAKLVQDNYQDSQNGIQIKNLGADNIFTLMQLKEDDIITAINNKTPSQKELVDLLQYAPSPLEITYLRADTQNKLSVSFNQEN